jgi:hypothetical protein
LPLLNFTLDGRVLPHALPKSKPVSAGFATFGKIARGDGTQPSALREAVLAVDKDVEVDVTGLPVCGYRKIASHGTQGARRACRSAIVGSGEASAVLTYPGSAPVKLATRLVAFNGGVRDGAIRVFVHAFAPSPLGRALVARVEVRRRGAVSGPRGWETLMKIPKIGTGYGSLTGFRLSLERRFLYRGERRSFPSARCPDGVFRIMTPKLLFKNEARIPGVAAQTVLKGSLAVPCTPKG